MRAPVTSRRRSPNDRTMMMDGGQWSFVIRPSQLSASCATRVVPLPNSACPRANCGALLYWARSGDGTVGARRRADRAGDRRSVALEVTLVASRGPFKMDRPLIIAPLVVAAACFDSVGDFPMSYLPRAARCPSCLPISRSSSPSPSPPSPSSQSLHNRTVSLVDLSVASQRSTLAR